MTHEELLAKLWILPASVTELQHGTKAVRALWAIVELHKPDDSNFCIECTHDFTIMSYPCPTAEAIEKALV